MFQRALEFRNANIHRVDSYDAFKECLDTEGGFKLMRVMRTRAPSLYFAGGEPTVRKDLPEITREARRLNYFPIIINTNGSLLHRWLKKEEWSDGP